MKNILKKKSAIVLLALVIPFSAVSAKDAPPETSFDGLSLIQHDKRSISYAKSDADIGIYDKIMLLPSQVAFKKNWKRDYNKDHRMLGSKVKDSDIERMTKNISELFDETFKEELSNVEGYTLVTKNGPGVLVLKPALINLDINAPDVRSTSRTRTFVETAGKGTLYLEFFDGTSNEILARTIDNRETRNRGYHSWASRITNTADTKVLLRRWAKMLKEKLVELKAN